MGSSLQHAGSFIAACGLFIAVHMHRPLSSCGVWAPERAGSVVVAHGLSGCGVWALECLGLVAPWHVGS